MPKTYNPQEAEPQLIQKWVDAGCYRRSKGVGDCTVVIPPPNVTGILHMGHAMDDSIQDTFIRYNRMRGRSTRWILGTDHAGIATQTKVDKKLKSEGKSRLKMGREKFLDACWDWTHEYGGTIVSQIKRMGCSIDFLDCVSAMRSSVPIACPPRNRPDIVHETRRLPLLIAPVLSWGSCGFCSRGPSWKRCPRPTRGRAPAHPEVG